MGFADRFSGRTLVSLRQRLDAQVDAVVRRQVLSDVRESEALFEVTIDPRQVSLYDSPAAENLCSVDVVKV